MVLLTATLVNKLDTLREHMKTLGSKSRICMVLANVNESKMQCNEKRSNTGWYRPANHLRSSWWDKPVIDSIRRSGVPFMQGKQEWEDQKGDG